MIKDVVGKVAQVGDLVAIGQAQRGAQEMQIGVIIWISEKTVTVELVKVGKYDHAAREVNRKERCFVILEGAA